MKRMITLLMILIAAPMFAQSPRHQVFQIIYHSRIPLSILRSQSLLAEDHTYTDQDLQLAMARLRRLPFVYSVSYALEGSTLAIDVGVENRLFWSFDFDFLKGTALPGFTTLDMGIGGRYYMGWGGVAQGTVGVEATTDIERTPLSAQYTQYGLGGMRGFLTLGLSKAGGGGDLAPLVVIGYPLTLRQSIRISGTHVGTSKGLGSLGQFGTHSTTAEIHRQNLYQLEWLWDTTVDPLFTTRGNLISIGPSYTKSRDYFAAVSKSFSFSNDDRSNITAVEGSAEKFWQVGARSAITGAVDLITSHSSGSLINTTGFPPIAKPAVPFTEKSRHAGVTVGYVHNFFAMVERPSERRNRAEVAFGMAHESFTRGFERSSDNYWQGQLGYAFRSHVGTFHLVGTYLWR